MNRMPSWRTERGFSFVVSLFFIVLLMTIAGGLAYRVRAEASAMNNFKDETQAYYLAVAGLNRAIAEISGDFALVVGDEDGSALFAVKNDEGYSILRAGREFALGDGTVSYSIEDERGKINLNTAKRETLFELMRLLGADGADCGTIADAIIDWRDEDHDPGLEGAEDDYYSSVGSPYWAKDDPFDTTGEAALVKGMTKEVFHGTDDTPGARAFLTAYGDGKVNINTADEKVLVAALGAGTAAEILSRRATGFFERPVHGGEVTSGVFSVTSRGAVRGLEVALSAIVEKRGDRTVILSFKTGPGY